MMMMNNNKRTAVQAMDVAKEVRSALLLVIG
jgi:hypothetical protein